MKTIFTNDIDGTMRFIDKIEFAKSTIGVRTSVTSVPDAITVEDEYELKDLIEVGKPSRVIIQKCIVGIDIFLTNWLRSLD